MKSRVFYREKKTWMFIIHWAHWNTCQTCHRKPMVQSLERSICLPCCVFITSQRIRRRFAENVNQCSVFVRVARIKPNIRLSSTVPTTVIQATVTGIVDASYNMYILHVRALYSVSLLASSNTYKYNTFAY